MRKFNLSFVVFILMMLQSCAYFDAVKVVPYKSMGESELYEQGSMFLSNGDIPSAVTTFETLEARFPFSTYSQQSILDLAFAYYDYGEKDSTIAECDRFIDLYPNHPNLDYAFYLRALSNLEKGQPFFQEILGQDVSKYDVSRLKDAYNDFLLIANRFKDSKYNGKGKYYYNNGKLWIKSNYQNGKLNGDRFIYHEDGSLEKKETYKDGINIFNKMH